MKKITLLIFILSILFFSFSCGTMQEKKQTFQYVSHYEVYDANKKYLGTTEKKWMKDPKKFWLKSKNGYIYGINRNTGSAIISDTLNFSDYNCKGKIYKFVYARSVPKKQLYIVKIGSKIKYFRATGDKETGYISAISKVRISHSYIENGKCKKNHTGKTAAIKVEEIKPKNTGVVLKSKPPHKFIKVMAK